MTMELRMFRIKSRKPYWGVLAPDPAYKAFHNPNNLMGLLQAQYKNAEMVPVSAQDRIPGKEKNGQSSEDISV